MSVSCGAGGSSVTFLTYEPGDVQAGAVALQEEAEGTLVLLVGENLDHHLLIRPSRL